MHRYRCRHRPADELPPLMAPSVEGLAAPWNANSEPCGGEHPEVIADARRGKPGLGGDLGYAEPALAEKAVHVLAHRAADRTGDHEEPVHQGFDLYRKVRDRKRCLRRLRQWARRLLFSAADHT